MQLWTKDPESAQKIEYLPRYQPWQWKWERITMDFVPGLPITPQKNDAVIGREQNFGTSYDPRHRETSQDNPRLIEKAFDRQKAYADTKRRDIRYEVEGKVFLKVSPWKKVLRVCKKGKLSPRYIGPFEGIEKVGIVAYRLALPLEFDKIHDVFHVSMLRRDRSDPSHILESKEVELNPDLSYKEEPAMILDREVKRL
ncbi:hypothetical protein V6N13_072141 [Hibiscus sabdariffa]